MRNGSDRWSAAGLFVVGLVVYGWQVATPGPWRDEAATLAVSRRDVGGILAVTQHVDVVHLAFYLLAHMVLLIHDSITSVRLISVVAMAAAAAGLVVVGRLLGDVQVGTLAGALLVISPLASRWAGDARPFAMVTLAAVLSTIALLAACRGSGSWRRWGWYAASLPLLGVLNVLSLLLVAAHAVFVVVTVPSGERRRWLRAAAAGAGAATPFVALAYTQREQVAWITPPHLYDLEDVFLLPFGARPALLVMAVTVLAVSGSVLVRRRFPAGPACAAMVLGGAWAVLPPLLLWCVSQRDPFWDVHYVLFALPGLTLALAQLLRVLVAPLRQAWPRGALTAGLVGLLAVIGLPAQQACRTATGHGEDLRGAAAYLATHADSGDAVLYAPDKLRVIGTIYPGQTGRLADVALASSPIRSGTLHGVEVPTDTLRRRLQGYPRVWLVHGPVVSGPTDGFKLGLTGVGYRLTGEVRLAYLTVDSYQLTRPG